MKIRTFVPSILAASMALAQAAGAAAVIRVFVVVVPPAQDQAFSQGIKDWNKCLHDHGSRHTALVYSAVTGDLDRYLFLDEHGTWADMDNHDPAGKACAPTFISEVLPNAGHAFSEIAVLNSRDSYMPGDDPDPSPMLWVDAYQIKPGRMEAFGDVMAKFAAAAAKTHWQGHFGGYDIEGSGQDAEDFVLIWPNESWADIGRDHTPSVEDLMGSVYGKAAARGMQAKYAAAIAAHWSEGWSYEKGLSYIPGK